MVAPMLFIPCDMMSSPQPIASNAFARLRHVKDKDSRTHFQSGSMDYNSSGSVFSLRYSVNDDKVMEAVMKQSVSSGKPSWASTNDEDCGSIGKRHADNM